MMDIAESVGFDNSLYFSRVFHKQMGMPPTEYAPEKMCRLSFQQNTHKRAVQTELARFCNCSHTIKLMFSA